MPEREQITFLQRILCFTLEEFNNNNNNIGTVK